MSEEEPAGGTPGTGAGWLEGLMTLKVVLPVIFAVGTAAGGLVTLGMRISDLGFRIAAATTLAGELKGRLDVALPAMTTRVAALEYRAETGMKERAAIWQQLAQNRDALGAKLDELRKDREAASNKLSRIEAQLEDLRAMLAGIEGRARRMAVIEAAWTRSGNHAR